MGDAGMTQWGCGLRDGLWWFTVTRLGGHTPLAALAPLSLDERGHKRKPAAPKIGAAGETLVCVCF